MYPMRGFGMIMFLLLLLLFFGPLWLPRPADSQDVPYSQFIQDVQAGKVAQVKIAGQQVTARYRDGKLFRTVRPLNGEYLSRALSQAGVRVEYAAPAGRPWWMGLTSFLPMLVLVGLLYFMTRSGSGAGGQIMQFGQSRARLYKDDQSRVTMEDVAGLDEVKEELQEVVDFLRSPERYREIGARIPKGVLLLGPPGTGKTLLARAVAGEAGVPFFAGSGSDFVEMFAGVGAARVRDLFDRAKQNAPCIIFLDEIDAVGRYRGLSFGGANEEREQTLNQLLVEMDGFNPNDAIIVIAATNRPDVLDPAILRPGRFDRLITVDLPDVKGRDAILRVHARGKPLADDVDLSVLARQTSGFSGADLANLINEGALLAARRRAARIHQEHLQNALERVLTGGPERKRLMSFKEKQRVAFHEAGHALVSKHLPHGEPVAKISIVARGRAAGYTLYLPLEDRRLHTRDEILDRLASLMGGRAAEEIALGEVSTGASDDLERATNIARRMVTELGMSPELGPIKVEEEGGVPLVHVGMAIPGHQSHSDRLDQIVDDAVKALIYEAYSKAKEILHKQRQFLDRLAHALLERETISGGELEELLA